jgi:hypothetical protein
MGTPASSTTKSGRHDIAEILLKVALSQNQVKSLDTREHMATYFLFVFVFSLRRQIYC